MFTPSFTGIGSSETQERSVTVAEEDVFKPPLDPDLLPRYLDIVNRPGPRSQKRRKLSELHNNNRSEEATRNSQPELVIDENEADQIYQRLVQASQKRKSSQRSSRSGSNSFNYSSSSSSRMQRTPHSSEDRLIPSGPNILQNSLPNISPTSSQLTQQSPKIYQRRRLSPSSSLTSNEEVIISARSDTPPVPTRQKTPPVPTRQVSPPVDTRQLTPPTITGLRINDGNAHSNSGAPRRVNFINNPAAGASNRDSRAPNTKLIGG